MKKLLYCLIIVIMALSLLLLCSFIEVSLGIKLGTFWTIFKCLIIFNICKASARKIKRIMKI